MSDRRQQLGRWGEELAARQLEAANFRLAARNYRCPAGEMDLIVTAEDDLWVFVEVKTRQGDAYGRPEEAITQRKAQRLIQVAESYLQEHALVDVDWCIDVVAIELDGRGTLLRFEQIENAVTGW